MSGREISNIYLPQADAPGVHVIVIEYCNGLLVDWTITPRTIPIRTEHLTWLIASKKTNSSIPGGDVVNTSVRLIPEQPTVKIASSTTVWLMSTPTHAPGGRAPVYCGPIVHIQTLSWSIFRNEMNIYVHTHSTDACRCVHLNKKLKRYYWPKYKQ